MARILFWWSTIVDLQNKGSSKKLSTRPNSKLLYYQNVISINNKISQLSSNIFLLSIQPDIIVLTETWLRPRTLYTEMSLRGCTVFHRDMCTLQSDTTRAGGVVLDVRSCHQSSLIEIDTDSESAFISLNFANTSFLIAVAYINSGTYVLSSNSFFTKLEYLKIRLPSHETVIVESSIWSIFVILTHHYFLTEWTVWPSLNFNAQTAPSKPQATWSQPNYPLPRIRSLKQKTAKNPSCHVTHITFLLGSHSVFIIALVQVTQLGVALILMYVIMVNWPGY